jgi:protein required for attachment to host cells
MLVLALARRAKTFADDRNAADPARSARRGSSNHRLGVVGTPGIAFASDFGMISTGLLVVDNAHARFLVLEPSPADPDAPRRLVECDALADFEADLSDQQVYANLKGGRNRAPGAGPAHAYDEHRAQHRLENHRRFARRIAERARSFAEEREVVKLLLVAGPTMLGVLRSALEPRLPAGVTISEVAEDLGRRTVPEIREALELRGVLEPRPIGEGAYQPRGQAR